MQTKEEVRKKVKARLKRKGVRISSYILTDKARKTIRQIALDKDIKDYQALEQIIKTCSMIKNIYKSK